MLKIVETDNLGKFLRPRVPLWHKDFPAVLLWSGKSGCTTVLKWFFMHLGLLEEARKHSAWIHDYETDVLKRAPGYMDGLLAKLRSGCPVVKFVRDPYARAYSGYLELCRPRILNKQNHWAYSVRCQVLKDLAGSAAEVEYAFSFEQFVRWLSRQDVASLNHHLAPQFTELESFLEVEYLKVESFAGKVRDLESRLSLPLSSEERIDKLVTSGHHHQKNGRMPRRQLLRLTRLAVPMMRGPDFRFLHIDCQTIAGSPLQSRLARIFQQDVERYGYCWPAKESAAQSCGTAVR